MSGSLGIRETEITKEIDIRQVGTACLSCGHGQQVNTAPARYLPPIEWDLSFRGVLEQEKASVTGEGARQQGSTALPVVA